MKRIVGSALAVGLFSFGCGGPAPEGQITPPMLCNEVSKEGESRKVKLTLGALFTGPEGTIGGLAITDCTMDPVPAYFSADPIAEPAACAGWTGSGSSTCKRQSGQAESASGIFSATVVSTGPGTITCQAKLELMDESFERIPATGDLTKTVSCKVL